MEIRALENRDIDSLYQFNHKVYPEREKYKEIIDFWFSRHPDAYKLTNILCENNTIYGQALYSSMNYFYNQEKISSLWGFDLIIEEKQRKNAYGIDILQYALERFESIFATGSGPMALKINLALGSKRIGEIKKQVGIINPVYFISAFRGIIPVEKFPESVKVSSDTYKKVTVDNLPDMEYPYNKDFLEICREKDFLKWRFFNHLHDYAVYKSVHSDNYFVLRTIVRKHTTCMVLVDFRCNLSNTGEFETILNMVKKIMHRLRLPVLITGSSLQLVDDILVKHHFKTIGYNRPVISTIAFKEKKKDIQSRNFVLVTLADSDGEILW